MSEETEKMYKSFILLKVPDLWAKNGFLSMKKLASWFDDLVSRVDFFKKWQATPELKSYSIGSFFFPQGFVTAVL